MATWTKIAEFFSSGQSASNQSALVLSESFRIDLQNRELAVEGKSVWLTDDEVNLLLFLNKHPKHFVSPHTALSTRWNDSRAGKAEFLRVLCSLQRKLEAAGVKGRYIRVEPWYLYSFDPAP